ncbi:class I SAM-dependent methyltransferase [Subtercola sp. YIM 133946]|uniref:class I SAM-dependent methyltransferase n=1 Tax=Subtercola sp. YIM 133946 TaxID=3118909 RepID=UPI002F9239D4
MPGTDSGALSAYSDHRFNPQGSNDSWSNLFAYVPAGSRVLDVGCSTGTFGEALERLKSCTVVGVDLDAADIAEAATKISSALVFDVTSAESLDELGMFDVIVCADLLEHLPNPRAALRRLTATLNPGGLVAYSIPNMTHTSVRLDLLRGVFGYTQTGILDKTHLHFYDRVEVDDMFVSSGFSITAENPVVFPYPTEMVEGALRELGLATLPGGEFERMLAGTDANILQFVGMAVPSIEPSTPLDRQRVFPPEEINAYLDLLRADAARVAGELAEASAESGSAAAERDEQRQRADAAEAELEQLRARITALREHPVRFALNRVRRR